MRTSVLLASLLVVATTVGVGAPAIAATQQAPSGQQAVATQQSEAYSGTHVSFGTGSNAVVDYTVNGEAILRNLSVQSKSKARQGGIGAGVSLSAVTGLSGARISSTTTGKIQASVGFASGAKMTAHDNGRGVLVIRSGGESQYVEVGVSAGSSSTQAGENRVVVTNDNGTDSVFLVVGSGQVAVNDAGNVTAEIGQDGKLVYRQYEGDRSQSDKSQERLITDGTAAAEVYVQQTSDNGSRETADVVRYGEDTTVDVNQRTQGRVDMTVDRASDEGRVILCTVSRQVFESRQDIRVLVDGSAATSANSYDDIRQSIGGDTSTYLVRESSSATATADVAVGVNHFSSRSVTLTSEDGTDTATEGGMGEDGDEATDGGVPGFGPGVALLAAAVLAGVMYARRRI